MLIKAGTKVKNTAKENSWKEVGEDQEIHEGGKIKLANGKSYKVVMIYSDGDVLVHP